ncbi:uncharacterized protein LOC131435947 [Malaya genurostris]|uniref:uncharacterized protein LOC131435947 n=1 Tax=Malaya genurostris TaxID=325434 RepID=UPI0026F3B1C1|nr:uncharacterized protein LOC131435947 [Malaya genurostris]
MNSTEEAEAKCIAISIATDFDEINEDCDEKSRQYFVMRNFIAAYESLPELWNPSDPMYTNRKARINGLEKLAIIYRDWKPRAKQEDVKRKINTLRSNYWKLWKKVEQSKLTALNENDVYQPTSWVFHALRFLGDLDQPVENTKISAENTQILKEAPDEIATTEHITPVRKRKQFRKRIIKSVNPLKTSQWQKDLHDSSWDLPTVARVWGEKLIDLDPQQRLFAEKAINDILFEANMGCLHRNSVKINEDSSSGDHNYEQRSIHLEQSSTQHFVATSDIVNDDFGSDSNVQ